MPGIQESVGVTLTYGVESTFGTAAAGGGASQAVRRVSSTMSLAKDAFASNEVRSDQQISVFRHGGHRISGMIEGELSTVTYDDWLAALLRGTWVVGVSKSQTDFTNVTIATVGVCTFGTGNPITQGFKIGDIVRWTGLSVTANNNINVRITALTATTMTTYPALADNTLDASFTVAVVGRKLLMGLGTNIFTIEQNNATSDVSELFTSCRVAGASIRMPPNGIASVSFEFQGQKGSVLSAASAPYFTAITAAPETDALTGIEGGLRLAGVEQTIVTGLDLSVSLNMSSQPVIGTPYVPDIFYGRMTVTGSISFFLKDETLLNAFLNETEVDLVVNALASGVAPQEFLCFNMQRVKLTSVQKQVGGDGGVIVSAQIQALRKPITSGYDVSTLVIQRSNA